MVRETEGGNSSQGVGTTGTVAVSWSIQPMLWHLYGSKGALWEREFQHIITLRKLCKTKNANRFLRMRVSYESVIMLKIITP